MIEDRPPASKLTVLGCAGSFYDEKIRTPCSSYLVELDSTSLLLDCGFGSFDSFMKHTPDTLIDIIFVSHAHGDHAADLGLFMNSANIWRTEPRLIASENTMALIAPDRDTMPESTLLTVNEGPYIELANVELEFSLTTHKMPTFAVCVSNDRSRILYGADTGPTWSLPPSFRDPGVAILECTIEKRDEASSLFHLDAYEFAQLASTVSAGRTVISHLPPGGNGAARLSIARDYAPEQNFVLASTGLQLHLD